MRHLLRWTGFRVKRPCRGCGTRNLWSLRHGEWCLYTVLFSDEKQGPLW
jgi:hypothetical protein